VFFFFCSAGLANSLYTSDVGSHVREKAWIVIVVDDFLRICKYM
jgi:hypothetical protein